MPGKGDATIDILLATYNGAAFLEEQLESLLGQEFTDWRLLVRDDGSGDRTVEILETYRTRLGGKMTILRGPGRKLGARGNFEELLRHSDAPYAMFCDQDDVWLPGKISSTLEKMREMEARHGQQGPLMVHCDFQVVDEKLAVVAGSGWRYQGGDPNRCSLNRILVQNVATGCTIMLNGPLRRLALPIPERALMHDWWAALVAAGLGKIGYVPQPLLLYRQHGVNAVGAKRSSLREQVKRLAGLRDVRAELRRIQAQGAALLEAFDARLGEKDREAAQAFAGLGQAGFFQRRYHLVRYRLFHAGWLRKAGMLLFC